MGFDGKLPTGWGISSRLLAEHVFEDASSIEVGSDGIYRINAPDGRTIAHGSDFRPSPLSTGWADVLSAFVAFLSADAEAYAYGKGVEPENGWLFGADGAEWAYLHDSELDMLSMELEPA